MRWRADWEVPDAAPQLGTIYDISAQGVFIRAADGAPPLAWGQEIRIHITSPDGRVDLEAPAVVRWSGRSLAHGCDGFGLEFVEIQEAIDAYVRQG